MNNDETYTPCTKCGRPMAYCKGQCCGKTKGCQCKEYCGSTCAAIRPGEPKCPPQAVIPSLTVESVSNLKDLADCFVHVSDINTTFYIDDKHRIMTTWAGLVSVEDYDFDANPLNLRGQIAYDSKNNVAAIYDKQGANYIFQISDINNDYLLLSNKPSINGVELSGNKTSADLGVPDVDEVALVFDTVADMKQATNLVNGSFARTLGFYDINDGGGATYHISNTGTANEMDIIAVNTLKAHLILPAILSPEMIGASGDGLTDDTAYFARACELSNSILIDKSYVISSTTIPNGTKISGDGTIIATSITVGANTTIDGINITVPENATAFVINNLGSTSNNNDIFNNLTFTCNSGSTCFNIYPTHTNSGLYNIRFNNITASGNYNKFIDINNNSKWVTAISISNVYAGSPKNVLANNNNIDNVSYVSGIELFNVKSQANSNTEHFITTNAGKLLLYGCNVDELSSYSYKMIYINNNKAKVLVSGINSMTNLVGSSLYNDHTALALNIIVDNVVDANEFNQVLLSEISNAGNAEATGPFIGVGSLVSLNVDSTRISGMQITPGSRVSTDGRSFLLGFNNSGVPHYADVKNGNYYEIPYTGKLKTYSTSNRPATANNGDCIFDTTLKQPIYWYGKWLKYDGTDA